MFDLRREYHRRIFSDVLRIDSKGVPNNADKGSNSSIRIGNGIIEKIGLEVKQGRIAGQTVGARFEGVTRTFLQAAFELLHHLRPGEWEFSLGGKIDEHEQYQHLRDVHRAVQQNKDLRVAFGDYIVKPDVVIRRRPVSDMDVNKEANVIGSDPIALYTPLRRVNSNVPILHASVSCKWTLRSDRSQNARTEGLNLIRNRKGRAPHIVVVVGEPLPGRIASLAYGTGDIDCIYHYALPELAASTVSGDSDSELLNTLIDGKRLRDIADLPFDIVI